MSYSICTSRRPRGVCASATDPGLNRSFREYAESRRFFPDTARVRHPKDKARVENALSQTLRSLFAVSENYP